ncbi:MAG: hypothetical protein M0Z53_14275 [Thermaerobacter sp.]|nr:hypothetical protein [Thermaerobacter sp.]
MVSNLSFQIRGSLLPDVHPMLVHFPIVLLLLAAGFDVLSYIKRDPFFTRMQWWTLSLAVLTTVTAVLSGYLAKSLVHWPPSVHRRIERMELLAWITLASTVASWLLLRWSRPKRAGTRRLALHLASTLLLWAAIVFITLTARAGATLVFHTWLRTMVPALPTATVVTLPVLAIAFAGAALGATALLLTGRGRPILGAALFLGGVLPLWALLRLIGSTKTLKSPRTARPHERQESAQAKP